MKPAGQDFHVDHAAESRLGFPTVTVLPPKHFRCSASFISPMCSHSGNAACGLAGVFFAMLYMSSHSLAHFWLPRRCRRLRCLFDWFDGRVAIAASAVSARAGWIRQPDIISFGVVPAGSPSFPQACGRGGIGSLTYFVCCGVSRLARHNAPAERLSAGHDKVAYFEGTPSDRRS